MESSFDKLGRAFSVRQNLRHLFYRSEDNLKAIDGLRAISTILLVVFHCFWHLQYVVPHRSYRDLITAFPYVLRWVWHGDKGVDIFFVISGFLIGSILFKEWRKTGSLDIKRFYYRRAMRILPAYLIALSATYLLTQGFHAENIWANLLFVNQLVPFDKMFMPWSWSLAVEMQFYLLFPIFLVLVLFRVRQRFLLLAAIFFSSFLIRWLLVRGNEDFVTTPMSTHMFPIFSGIGTAYFDKIHVNSSARFGPLICGAAAAYLMVFQNAQLKRFFADKGKLADIVWLISIAVIFLTMSVSYFNPESKFPRLQVYLLLIFNTNIFALAVAFIMVSSLFPARLSALSGYFLGFRIWYPIAQLSYSIFLFHVLMLLALFFLVFQKYPEWISADPGYILIGSVLVFILSALVATLVYLGVERPLMNLRNPRLAAFGGDKRG